MLLPHQEGTREGGQPKRNQAKPPGWNTKSSQKEQNQRHNQQREVYACS